ncbi:MAG: restriction endonuclease [Methylococcaceae bacterium]
MANKKWKDYEKATIYLLNQFASAFSLDGFLWKETIHGHHSGTDWEIDGKGFNDGNDGFLIVECRRYTTSKQCQEKIAALAYKIHDTGATGGIIVSPMGLQSGAEKVASAENVISVKLTPNITNQEYMMEFLNKIMIGISEKAIFSTTVHGLIYRKGKLID